MAGTTKPPPPAKPPLPDCLVQLGAELPPTLGAREAAALLRCRDRFLRHLVATGELRAFRRVRRGSSRLIFVRGELLRYLARIECARSEREP